MSSKRRDEVGNDVRYRVACAGTVSWDDFVGREDDIYDDVECAHAKDDQQGPYES